MFDRTVGNLSVTIVKVPASSTVRSLPTDALPAAPVTITKTGCLVESQSRAEEIGLASRNVELAWFFFPPDSDTLAISSFDVLRFNNRDFTMQGPAAIEYNLDGEPVVVWCVAQWEAS